MKEGQKDKQSDSIEIDLSRFNQETHIKKMNGSSYDPSTKEKFYVKHIAPSTESKNCKMKYSVYVMPDNGYVAA